MSCLNPFDVQSRHIMTEDGQAECLYSGVGGRGGQQYVLVHRQWSGDADRLTRYGNDVKLYARSTNRDGKEK